MRACRSPRNLEQRVEESMSAGPDVERPVLGARTWCACAAACKIEYTLGPLGAERLWRLLRTEPYVRALGAQTGAQAVQMVQAGLKAIYVSGWQVAGDMNTAEQTYPDQSLYPADSVPTLVRRINNALQRADQIAHNDGISDADALLVRPDRGRRRGRLRRRAERLRADEGHDRGRRRRRPLRGPARPRRRSAGTWAARCWCPPRRPISKLVAARLAADVLDVPTLLIARTDALAARLLTSDIDRATGRSSPASGPPRASTRSATGLEQAIARGLAYAPYADMVWCETSTPDLDEARQFAEAIHAHYPGKLLAYNCSPSFNWKRTLSDEQIATFQRNLGAMGYKFQFVTLAGFHALNMSMFELAHAYRDEGMLAYSRLQQREFELERDHGYRAVKHQTFVGAGYFDAVAQVIAGGPDVRWPRCDGSTEQAQFTEKTPVFSEAEIHHVAGDDLVRLSRMQNSWATRCRAVEGDAFHVRRIPTNCEDDF